VLEKQRTNLARSITLLIFALYLLANGQNIAVPFWGISISEIPGINMLIAFVLSFSFLFFATTSVSIGAYDGLMSQVAKRVAHNATFDPDILKAASHPQQLFVKVFSKRFNSWSGAHIEPYGLGVILYAFTTIGILAVAFLLFAAAYAYAFYFVFNFFPVGIVGNVGKVLVTMVLGVSIIVHLASILPIKNRWVLSERDVSDMPPKREKED